MMEGNKILCLDNVSHVYKTRSGIFEKFTHIALDNISFSVMQGETLGIVGHNGSGKSSLLKIMAGIISPTSGTVHCQAGVSRALLALGLGFRGDLTGRDNVILSLMFQGFTLKKAKSKVASIKEFSELEDFFDRPVRTYSAGMKSRLGFSTAITNEVGILFIDEVLSVGDEHFRRKAEQVMLEKLKSNQTVVFVSHSHEQVRRLCDSAVWLDAGKIRLMGNAQDICEKYSNFMKSSR